MPDFTVCSNGPVRAPAERPPCPDSIPPRKRPLRALQTLTRPILCAPDRAPFVSAGGLNFDRTPSEFYVQLAPHPRGWDYLLFEAVIPIRACLGCRCRPADRSPLAVLIVRCRRCRRGHWTRPCAHVDVMLSDFDDGGMLYYDRVGQGRKRSGLESVFAPGSREKHARVRISGHHANLA